MHLISKLFTGPSLHDLNFDTKNSTHCFLPFLFALGIELCHVKIGNTANSPKKVARHALYSCCTVKVCNMAYTYLYTTAVNEVTHLPTKFSLHEKLGGYVLVIPCLPGVILATQGNVLIIPRA